MFPFWIWGSALHLGCCSCLVSCKGVGIVLETFMWCVQNNHAWRGGERLAVRERCDYRGENGHTFLLRGIHSVALVCTHRKLWKRELEGEVQTLHIFLLTAWSRCECRGSQFRKVVEIVGHRPPILVLERCGWRGFRSCLTIRQALWLGYPDSLNPYGQGTMWCRTQINQTKTMGINLLWSPLFL